MFAHHTQSKHIQPKIIHLILDIRYCYLIHLMETFSSLLSTWFFLPLFLLSELISLFVQCSSSHKNVRLMKISLIIIVVGLKHVKLDDYIGYCSSQVFIILLFRHHCPAHLLFQYLFMSGKCCFLFYVLVFSLRAYCSFHCTKKTQMRDSLLKRPNCPLSRIQNEEKIEKPFHYY